MDKNTELAQWFFMAEEDLKSTPLPQPKTMIGRQIAAVDGQIDKAVYGLYGLTDEEVRVVEGEG